jgi:hypothetical protein
MQLVFDKSQVYGSKSFSQLDVNNFEIILGYLKKAVIPIPTFSNT